MTIRPTLFAAAGLPCSQQRSRRISQHQAHSPRQQKMKAGQGPERLESLPRQNGRVYRDRQSELQVKKRTRHVGIHGRRVRRFCTQLRSSDQGAHLNSGVFFRQIPANSPRATSVKFITKSKTAIRHSRTIAAPAGSIAAAMPRFVNGRIWNGRESRSWFTDRTWPLGSTAFRSVIDRRAKRTENPRKGLRTKPGTLSIQGTIRRRISCSGLLKSRNCQRQSNDMLQHCLATGTQRRSLEFFVILFTNLFFKKIQNFLTSNVTLLGCQE